MIQSMTAHAQRSARLEIPFGPGALSWSSEKSARSTSKGVTATNGSALARGVSRSGSGGGGNNVLRRTAHLSACVVAGGAPS